MNVANLASMPAMSHQETRSTILSPEPLNIPSGDQNLRSHGGGKTQFA
ncbi:hypothetical protein RIEGSTA812A_PEG_827 [invertebrate metagenome]|uniref:Uncharacterized protein n=1 Tax=invertebrate metagenome TaxID=1711999 RepID=A0A484H6V6_9ZZZZ